MKNKVGKRHSIKYTQDGYLQGLEVAAKFFEIKLLDGTIPNTIRKEAADRLRSVIPDLVKARKSHPKKKVIQALIRAAEDCVASMPRDDEDKSGWQLDMEEALSELT